MNFSKKLKEAYPTHSNKGKVTALKEHSKYGTCDSKLAIYKNFLQQLGLGFSHNQLKVRLILRIWTQTQPLEPKANTTHVGLSSSGLTGWKALLCSAFSQFCLFVKTTSQIKTTQCWFRKGKNKLTIEESSNIVSYE